MNSVMPSVPLQAVFFDLDDTLISTSDADNMAYEHVHTMLTSRFQRTPAEAKEIIKTFRRKFELTPWDMTREEHVYSTRQRLWYESLEAGGVRERTAAQIINETFRDQRLRRLQLSEEVLRGLDALRRRNIKVGIITNGHELIQREKLATCGAYRYFEHPYMIIGGEERLGGRHEKPNSSIFEELCRRMHVEPRSCMHVGDSWATDMAGALNAGLSWRVWISDAHTCPSSDANIHTSIFVDTTSMFSALEEALDINNCILCERLVDNNQLNSNF